VPLWRRYPTKPLGWHCSGAQVRSRSETGWQVWVDHPLAYRVPRHTGAESGAPFSLDRPTEFETRQVQAEGYIRFDDDGVPIPPA